ncbi:MAG: tRNA lysidine(34) synthetase TilS [Pasteurellaceae bacterium]|nr:tRNA lysidine(34) synthetase TilS [Pasteurellaceae bacterium]
MITPFLNQCPQQKHFLIGLSGGVDSVVLLHLFKQLQAEQHLHLRAVHIHHGLSPSADHWAAFCQSLCEQWQIPLIVRRVKVEGSQGLEANARTARYQAIRDILQPNEWFATAHHLDDQVETFFLALKRGAGLKGLSAMQGVRSFEKSAIFRPLLGVSKAEILAYAEQHQLPWIVDESNADSRFDRNFLRNEILPPLNQRWSQFNQMVARTSQLCAEQETLIEELLTDELNARFELSNQSLKITDFAHFSKLKQQQLVRLWLEKCQQPMPSQAQLQQILQLIEAERDKNPQVQLGEKMIRRYQERIYLTEKSPLAPLFQRKIEIGEVIELPDNLGTISRTQNSLQFCKNSDFLPPLQLPETLRNQPLTIKFGVSGKVKLFGKFHREEMKKIWQQNGVPVWERQRTPLVFWGDQLVAVLTLSPTT